MRLAVGLVLAVAGVVWVLQGLNVSWAPQSFMTGDWRWVLVGLVAVIGGVGLLVAGRSKE